MRQKLRFVAEVFRHKRNHRKCISKNNFKIIYTAQFPVLFLLKIEFSSKCQVKRYSRYWSLGLPVKTETVYYVLSMRRFKDIVFISTEFLHSDCNKQENSFQWSTLSANYLIEQRKAQKYLIVLLYREQGQDRW